MCHVNQPLRYIKKINDYFNEAYDLHIMDFSLTSDCALVDCAPVKCQPGYVSHVPNGKCCPQCKPLGMYRVVSIFSYRLHDYKMIDDIHNLAVYVNTLCSPLESIQPFEKKQLTLVDDRGL